MENSKSKIVLMKLYNGEYIIGEKGGVGIGKVDIINPRMVIMMPTMSGSMGISLKPICFPFTSKRLKDLITLESTQIMFELEDELGEIEKDIVNGYKSDITGIKIATAVEAASVAKGGDIII